MIEENGIAPDFTTKNQNGDEIKLSDYRGKKVVLYFYPKDDTPGCTKEACSFRDSNDVYAQQKFISKYNLPFNLLADTEKEIVSAYGVYGEKSMYGKKYMGVNRTTFLIDEQGKIVKIFKKINVSEHASEVLEAFGA
jgi:thioredoxin-dependent peroxiredoxin